MALVKDRRIVHEHVHCKAGAEATGTRRGDSASVSAEHGGFEDGRVGGMPFEVSSPEIEKDEENEG